MELYVLGYIVAMLLDLVQGALSNDIPNSPPSKTTAKSSVSAEVISVGLTRGPHRSKTQTETPPRPSKYDQFTTISDLVRNRPHTRAVTATREYMRAFASHADVRTINFHHDDEKQLAQKTLRLRDPTQTPTWQKNLTYTLRRLFKDAEVDTDLAENVLGSHYAGRQKQAHTRRKARLQDSNPDRLKRNQISKQYYQKNKERRKAQEVSKFTFINELDALVGDRGLTALQVAREAEALRTKYPEEKQFQIFLRAYFNERNYPAEDISMIQGTRSMHREKNRSIKSYRRKKGEAKGQASTSTLPALPKSVSEASSHAGTVQDTAAKGTSYEGKKRMAENGKVLSSKRTKVDKMKSSDGQMDLVRLDNLPARTSSDPRKNKEVDSLECGAWWESGCFDH